MSLASSSSSLQQHQQLLGFGAEDVSAGREMVRRLTLTSFDLREAYNPVLQRHYAAVQALALLESKPADSPDLILPNPTRWADPLVEAWRQLVIPTGGIPAPKARAAPKKRLRAAIAEEELLGEGENGQAEPREGAGAAGGRAVKVAKREPGDAAEWNSRMLQAVQTGEISRLSVADLKEFLKFRRQPISGKKADLIERVQLLFSAS